jgi:hypothetical protein
MPWAEVFKTAVSLGYTSHQSGSCGLHVHVSRLAFGETETRQEAAIARVLYFFEKFWEELLKFSRRTPRQLDRWAARYGYKEQPRDILKHAKKGYHGGRYTCVNLSNADTIELRIFRGTLKWNTLMATLELADRICDVALCLSDEELKALSWTTFVCGCQAPELVRYPESAAALCQRAGGRGRGGVTCAVCLVFWITTGPEPAAAAAPGHRALRGRPGPGTDATGLAYISGGGCGSARSPVRPGPCTFVSRRMLRWSWDIPG